METSGRQVAGIRAGRKSGCIYRNAYFQVNGTIDADHANEAENKTFYVNLYKDGKFATAEDGGVGSLKKDQIGTATAAKGYAQDSLKWTPAAPTTDLKLSKDTEFVAAFEKDSFGDSI